MPAIAFDPSQPFVEETPKFDPSQPFQEEGVELDNLNSQPAPEASGTEQPNARRLGMFEGLIEPSAFEGTMHNLLGIKPKPTDNYFQQGVQGAIKGVANLGSTATSVGGAAMLPLFSLPVIGPALAGYLGAESLGTGAGNVVAGLEQHEPKLVGEGLVEGGVGALMGRHAVKGGLELARPKPVVPLPQPKVPLRLTQGVRFEGQQSGPSGDLRNPILPEGFSLPEENTPAQMAQRAEEALNEAPVTSQGGKEISPISPKSTLASNAKTGASSPLPARRTLAERVAALGAEEGQGEVKKGGFESLEYSPEDLEVYKDTKQKMKELLEANKVETPEYNQAWKEFEGVRGKYGGMPPKQGGLKVKEALEKNESGQEASVGLHLIDPAEWKKLGFKVGAKVDAMQLGNRLRNVLGENSFAWGVIKDHLPKGGKLTTDEFQKAIEDSAPKIKVSAYGMEGKVSEARKELDDLTHNWYDSLQEDQKRAVRNMMASPNYMEANAAQLSPIDLHKARRYTELKAQTVNEPKDTSPRATSAYTSVSALPTEEAMPEWTVSKSRKNVQRVDVVLPAKDSLNVRPELAHYLKEESKAKGILWQPDNLHENLPNTLGWVMVQYKTGAKGEKIAVVNEVQSRWGQRARELNAQVKNQVYSNDWVGGAKETLKNINHPLLHDYNRLILKAAIDQARKEGATHVFLSDAESAMMTEGHDNITMGERGDIPQEKGMRLNYDTTLPRLMEELVGSRGEKVSLGEHKNAFEKSADFTGTTTVPVKTVRENLIFKNAKGEPKTDLSGSLFSIEKAKQDFSTLGKDRAVEAPKPKGLQLGKGLDKPKEEGGGQLHKMVGEAVEKVYEGAKDLGEKAKEYLKGAKDTEIGKFSLDPSRPLPAPMPKEMLNEVASQPFASERLPVLGRLMGGKARIRTEVDRALAGWYFENHGVAEAVASSVGENFRGLLKEHFSADAKGDLPVKPTKPGQSLKMADVIEGLLHDPRSYILTERQRILFDKLVKPLMDRVNTLAKQADIIDETQDGPYFMRIVTKHPKVEAGGTNPRLSRAFSTEAEGWQRGYEYERDIEKRIVMGVKRLYRALANQRLAKDPVLKARSKEQVKADLAEYYSVELGSGQKTQRQIDRIAEGIESQGHVNQPILMRHVFTPDVARALNKEFAAEQSRLRKGITEVNSTIKALQLGFDFGVGQIQGLVLLARRPDIWARSQAASVKSFFNDKAFSAYVRKNAKEVNELAQLGISVGRQQEFTSGLSEKGLIPKVPGLKQAAAAFGRQFQTSLDVAKVELWKAWSPLTPKAELPKLARTIESILLTERQEANMVPHGRALNERVFLLAPSYYRGAINLVAALGEKGVSGKQARKAIGSFLLSGTVLYYGVGKALGMKDEELAERLDPRRGDFLTWKVKQGDRVVNVGYGGIFRSFLRLAGNVVKTSQDHPENWKSLSPDKNPFTRWYRGHAGPTVSLTWDGFSGRDFLERETDVFDLSKRVLPLAAQQAVQRPEEGKATPVEYLGSFAGLSAQPESKSSAKKRIQEEEAQGKYKKPYGELKIGERLGLNTPVDKRLEAIPSGVSKERSKALAMQFADQRLERLKRDVGHSEWFARQGLEVPGYSTHKVLGGKELSLTSEELDILHVNTVEKYKEFLARLEKRENVKKEYAKSVFELARAQAWRKTLAEIGRSKETK